MFRTVIGVLLLALILFMLMVTAALQQARRAKPHYLDEVVVRFHGDNEFYSSSCQEQGLVEDRRVLGDDRVQYKVTVTCEKSGTSTKQSLWINDTELRLKRLSTKETGPQKSGD